jgi:hypothetical protein
MKELPCEGRALLGFETAEDEIEGSTTEGKRLEESDAASGRKREREKEWKSGKDRKTVVSRQGSHMSFKRSKEFKKRRMGV